ncbi:alanine dehydrogenase [uncultured Tateyamaria sp.]|uniref:alanine dehydrogenase n=1 Tax=uncultured Tateyamaria sp. TaxID=455651 RepID=UPI00261D1818|nr:alanine dehydrogenase [uncultured Tateyamaria sp.]
MLVGVPKEIKNHEYRVGLTPESVGELIAHGHQVIVETQAGAGIGAEDAHYTAIGAEVVADADAVFARAAMVVKVKEPLAVERAKLRPGQILYTYLHLAPDPEQTKDLVESGAICIAYETVTDAAGGLPLLKPMSQVAGRMSVQAGAAALEKAHGGRGVLLGGVPGVAPAKVTIIGGGVVGFNAAQMAVGMQADVTILDRSPTTLDRLSNHFGASAKVVFSTRAALEAAVKASDLVIGAVLIPGAAAPKLVDRALIDDMKPGAVVVDVAIDQGGCFETSKATTHADPTYLVGDVVHYCVANMPGGVARTSTYALNNATLPHAVAIANKGWKQAITDDKHLADGLNVANGHVTYAAVAKDLGYPLVSLEDALAS